MIKAIKRHLRGLSYAVWGLTILSSVALLVTRSLPALIAFLALSTCLHFLNQALLRQRHEDES